MFAGYFTTYFNGNPLRNIYSRKPSTAESFGVYLTELWRPSRTVFKFFIFCSKLNLIGSTLADLYCEESFKSLYISSFYNCLVSMPLQYGLSPGETLVLK